MRAVIVQATLDECAPEVVEVIYCDARVRGTAEFRHGEEVCLDPQGSGGTRFEPVFEDVEQQEEPPAALIYLTDGHGSFPDRVPDYPVLWASTESETFPFGQVLSISDRR